MALVRGIHIIAKGDRARAREIARDIAKNQRLLIGSNTMYGAGVYAWQEEFLPVHLVDQPQVIFEIDDSQILPSGARQGCFRIPGRINDYIDVRVLRFSNF